MTIIPTLLFLDCVIAYIIVAWAYEMERKQNKRIEKEVKEYIEWIGKIKGVW